MITRFVKKTIVLNQEYVDRAIKIFNVRTEKEAVNRALEAVVEDSDIIDVHNEIGGSGSVEPVFK
jgi:Arc/MetJ family transcription regulator